jgi:hypothetical protein
MVLRFTGPAAKLKTSEILSGEFSGSSAPEGALEATHDWF